MTLSFRFLLFFFSPPLFLSFLSFFLSFFSFSDQMEGPGKELQIECAHSLTQIDTLTGCLFSFDDVRAYVWVCVALNPRRARFSVRHNGMQPPGINRTVQRDD